MESFIKRLKERRPNIRFGPEKVFRRNRKYRPVIFKGVFKRFHPLTIFRKSSIANVLLGSE